MSYVIETQGLTREFGERRAVDGLDIQVEAGEVFGLLGPNGAGKTTTIRMLTTLLAPSRGRALVCGYDVRREAAQVRRRIGYVSQEKGVRHLLTARESVEIEADLHHVPRRERALRVTEVLDVVGLLPDADRQVAEFSGGMLKRLDLACGLLQRPEVLILDEPTLGLDVQSRHRVWEHVAHLRRQGVSVLLTTNYLDEADRLCDRVSIIDAGKEVVGGAPDTLKRAVGADVLHVVTDDVAGLRGIVHGRERFHRVLEAGPRTVNLHVGDALAALAEVAGAARERGIVLEHIGLQRPTLDDVFLLHTGRGPRGTDGERLPVKATPAPGPAPARPARRGALRGRPQETAALLRRWFLQLRRERLNLVFTLLQPAIWLVFFGSSLRRAVDPGAVADADYISFMLPGVIAFNAVGAGVSGAVPLLWDKETGYLGRLMSMPLARSSIVVSRLLFQMALGAVQAALIMLVALALGARPAAHAVDAVLVLVAVMLLTGTLTTGFIALAYGSSSNTTFFAISGFASFPLLFASNAFVALDAMPGWLAAIARFNPLTYAIEVIRGLVLDGWRAGLAVPLSVLVLFTAGCLLALGRLSPARSGRGLR
ncbi:ABC transporter permease [Streptomyces sp. AV19]|uniref:ABC transporter ATP-binding protein/permease n=1 Tax=Streptomyces sp. AV19 TaxID=2793068 RepID=UPI0018FE7865|nr:ATP-binding cassette domain-containing protein [Streptomyces sp. AV19]MBH1938392.1 ABC transporter permease [Streptomyces sp. AV19]MDG4535041.1 ABC transporter permease [Streptomyces sp. AV19]